MEKITLDSLNILLQKEIDKYANLPIGGKQICTPYFLDRFSAHLLQVLMKANISREVGELIYRSFKEITPERIPIGLYGGKGTPEEILEALKAVLRYEEIDPEEATKEGILDCMKLFGIGVDCSGFVYNCLFNIFSQLGMPYEFNKSLVWLNPIDKNEWPESEWKANHAWVRSFQGNASRVVSPSEVRALDIITTLERGRHPHIAVFYNKGEKLMVAQSTLQISPAGVSITEVNMVHGFPEFTFKPSIEENWNKMIKKDKLEFRRLKIIDELFP